MDFKLINFTAQWKDEDDLVEKFRFQDLSYVLFKNNESFYSEYLRNYRKAHNIIKSLVNEYSSTDDDDYCDVDSNNNQSDKINKNKNSKKAKSTICAIL